MIFVCSYNPVTDLAEVVPSQSVDILEVARTGVVAPVAKESFYNALEDIRQVGKRVRDVFDALDAGNDLAAAISVARSQSENKTD